MATLVIRKTVQVENSIQIVHCATRHHWILAMTVDCMHREIKIFNFIFFNCDKETLQTMRTLFQNVLEHPTITMCRCQKQAGTTDCGLFLIAYAVTLVHGMNPRKQQFSTR